MTARLLTPEDAATYLAVSPRTLRRLDVPRVLIRSLVRYDRTDLDQWLEKQKVSTSDGETGSRTRGSRTKDNRSLFQRASEIQQGRQRKRRGSSTRLYVVNGDRK